MIRNLYFRTCYLLLMETIPIFVLEGAAPELKYDTIAARNAIQFKGAKPKKDGVKTGKGRTRFHFVLRQCEEMLGYMGLACIKGTGEAESLCAYLNEDGLVDGCISQDSDCFAYGAKVVYRNFSISQQGHHTASGGGVDVYDITKANKSLGFGRNKIVALALLCGSDYSDGVFGVGKDTVMKLFETIEDDKVLDHIRSWKTNTAKYEQMERKVADKSLCTTCGHFGKSQSHTKIGCNQCGTTSGCDGSVYKEDRARINNELNIRKKALQDPNFPDEQLINEFLIKKDNVSKLNLKWKQPDLIKFINFTVKYLGWEELYTFEKFLPILTRWQLVNYELIAKQVVDKGIVYPDHIKKIRNPKGIPSYEIIWSDTNNFFTTVIPKSQLEENVDLEKLWSTIEPQILVDKAYPKLVYDFQQSKIKPKKSSKRKKKATVDELEQMLKNTSITEPKPKKTRKPREYKKKTISKDAIVADLESSFSELKLNQPKSKKRSIGSYFRAALTNSQHIKNLENEGSGGQSCISSTPVKSSKANDLKRDTTFDLDMSCFGDENDFDISDIVDKIICKVPNYLEVNLKQIGLKLCNEDVIDCIDKNHGNSSSFFISSPTENDLFEKTFDKGADSDSGDRDCTEEYEINEENFNFAISKRNSIEVQTNSADDCVQQFIANELVSDRELKKSSGEHAKDQCINTEQSTTVNREDNDSFSIEYVPLYRRVKTGI